MAQTLETRRSSASLELLIDLLACREPKLLPKKPRCAQNCRKSMSLPFAAGTIRDNSPLLHAKELCEPSKDSWSLPVALKKNFWDLGLGFSVGVVRMREGFAFFWLFFYDVIARTMSRNCGSKFGLF